MTAPAPPTPAPTAVHHWPKDPASVSAARRHLRGVLDRWSLENLAEAAELVVSELVTNAVQHARSSDRLMEVRYQPTPEGGLNIEVHDADDQAPAMRGATAKDESGRGLRIVDALTNGRWGVLPREPREGLGAVGKLIWAHIGPDPS
ncbi:ATP-binding protein [Streptomyces polygonati]|uniref:ATP-binding protein n=1 Tax=Streptomyces polygonati TaxID=1617087 RepID=A0ABV8HL69_9ACTN